MLLTFFVGGYGGGGGVATIVSFAFGAVVVVFCSLQTPGDRTNRESRKLKIRTGGLAFVAVADVAAFAVHCGL